MEYTPKIQVISDLLISKYPIFPSGFVGALGQQPCLDLQHILPAQREVCMPGKTCHKGAQIAKKQNACCRKCCGRNPECQRSCYILKGTIDHFRKLLSQQITNLCDKGGDQQHSRKEFDVIIANKTITSLSGIRLSNGSFPAADLASSSDLSAISSIL